jgi:hypothetical protein
VQDRCLKVAHKFQVPLELVQVILSLDSSELHAVREWMSEKRGTAVRVLMRQDIPDVYRSQGILATIDDFESLLVSIRSTLAKEGIDVT